VFSSLICSALRVTGCEGNPMGQRLRWSRREKQVLKSECQSGVGSAFEDDEIAAKRRRRRKKKDSKEGVKGNWAEKCGAER